MRTVLFDLDGTLVDSAALITEHLAGALRAVGAEDPGPAALMGLVGPPFETALPAYGLTAEQTAAAILHYRSTYDPVAAQQSALFPGIPALLEKLDAAMRSPVVMVGDRSHDVEGAIANGVPAIGVGWGYAEPGELAHARLVVPDLDALFLALTDDDPVWSQRAQP